MKSYKLLLILIQATAVYSYNVIEGVVLPEYSCSEIAGSHQEALSTLEKDHYVVPNERSPHVYARSLANSKGTLISVGTFRTLIAFTLGDFDRLIMLDIAQPILAFNREHLDSILNIQKNYASYEEQRTQYRELYLSYLSIFNKSGESYYWESDEKWEKIITALSHNKIHVVHGNFAKIESLQPLLDVLERLNTPLTLDHSNLFQYVLDDKTAYAKAIEAFTRISLDGSLKLLATTQYYTVNPHHDDSYTVFSVAHEQTSTHENSIDWVYYYFPNASSYLNYIDSSFYDRFRCEPIELENWQLDKVAHHVLTFMRESIDPNAVEQIEQFIDAESSWNLYWNLPLPLSESSKERVWCKVWQDHSCEDSVVDSACARRNVSTWYEEKLSGRNQLFKDWGKGLHNGAVELFNQYVKQFDLD